MYAQCGVPGRTREGQDLRDGTTTLQRTPAPGPVGTVEHSTLVQYAKNLLYVGQAWDTARARYAGPAIVDRAGKDFYEVFSAVLPSLLFALKGVVAATAVGAGIGAGAGALAGGVGAVPGAAAGAKAGFAVGVWILKWLGVGFLVVYVARNLDEFGEKLKEGVETAWNSGGSPPLIDRAARQMAEAVGIFASLLLQALVAYAAKHGVAAASQRLSNSRLGRGFARYLEGNRAAQLKIRTAAYLDALGRSREQPLVHDRAAVAVEFLERNFPQKDVLGYLRGIDFSRPVEVVTLQPGMTLVQYTGARIGNWFSRPGFSVRNMGISEAGRDRLIFRVDKPTQALRSRAAATTDSWTRGGRGDVKSPVTQGGAGGNGPKVRPAEFVDGGAEQYVIPNGAEQLNGAVPLRPPRKQ